MRSWIKNGARVALVAAGFAMVAPGAAGADTIGGRSHLAAAPGGTAAAGLTGNAAGRVAGAPMGGDLGTAASNGLSLSHKGLQSSGALRGDSALNSLVSHAACGKAALTHHHLGAGLAGSGALTGRRGNAAQAGSSLLP